MMAYQIEFAVSPKGRGRLIAPSVLAALATALLALSANSQEIVSGTNGKIVFTRTSLHGGSDIWTMNPDGSGQKQLTKGSGIKNLPRWSPNGLKIAFNSDKGNPGHPEVYVMNADGTGLIQLTSDPVNVSVQPAWSPDGTKIAFARSKNGGPLFHYDIYVMSSSDGSNLTNLMADDSNDTSDVDNNSPAWSPDGAEIAFDSTRSGSDNIWLMPATGSVTPTDLTPDSCQEHSPAWSPDGTKIAFDTFRDPNNPSTCPVAENVGTEEIWVMNSDGSSPAPLTSAAFDDFAAWSPDGTKIAFSSNGTASRHYNIFAMNPDGTSLVDLSNSTNVDDDEPDWAIAVVGCKKHCP